MFDGVKWSIPHRMVDVVSATEFYRLESWTASNRYQCDIVRYIRPTSECRYRLLSKWYIYVRIIVSATEFAKLYSPTSANNSIFAGVQNIFVHKIFPQHRPLSNEQRQKLMWFRSINLSSVELSTSFQQPNSIVADIKTITKWHFHLGFADMNIDICIDWPTWNWQYNSIHRYRSDIDCKNSPNISPTWEKS